MTRCCTKSRRRSFKQPSDECSRHGSAFRPTLKVKNKTVRFCNMVFFMKRKLGIYDWFRCPRAGAGTPLVPHRHRHRRQESCIVGEGRAEGCTAESDVALRQAVVAVHVLEGAVLTQHAACAARKGALSQRGEARRGTSYDDNEWRRTHPSSGAFHHGTDLRSAIFGIRAKFA